MNIIEITRKNFDSMTKTEKQTANYCLANLSDFAFDTLDVVAEKIGVSTTSVIRFCRRLGFSGYKDFQDCVRKGFKYQPDLPEKFKRTANLKNGNELMLKTVRKSVECINKTFEGINTERLFDAVKLLSRAKRVFTFGMRESFALAHYAYTRFLTVRDNVNILGAGNNGEIETLLSLDKDDVCVAFLFHRYTKQAIDILTILKNMNVKIILVTEAPFDNIKSFADVILPCYVDTNGIKNSSVAPVAITDYLCNALAIEKGEETLEYMKKSEKLFKEILSE